MKNIKKSWVIRLIAAVVAIGTLMGCGGTVGKYHTAPLNANELRASEMNVNAAELSNLYKSNRMAAKEKYDGKVVSVTGKIREVSELAGTGVYSVQFAGDASLIFGKFRGEHKGVLAKIKGGDTITIKGIVESHGDIYGTSYVTLNDAIIVKM